MTGRQQQWFHFGPWVFSIDAAQTLIAAAPRDTCTLDVTAWATAYGLTRLDDPGHTRVTLIGPAPGGLDRLYAMRTDLTKPVLVGRVRVAGIPPAALLIDGMHRLYHAWRKGVPRLPAYVLTAEETRRIQHDKLLGPAGSGIIPPSA
ncbi:hypothetical protein [Actinoplanes auranticolor]|uniref:ParB-like nuclease family protein n=1 Tax=Actinoplanes auranticolor TaxID=47988 RepID=A0A919SHR4_9ACTN|nr:hypothetical protein [Actinoplanes auranticolor]GIM72125.1 hypothetical protein Aau02nite_49330 [Actinoplanes auranticolor]